MQIVNSESLEFERGLSHRSGYIAFKYLLEGEENSPDNFSLVLADEGADFYSPRHRHAWDQVRFCVSGSVPIGPKVTLEAGEVGYFPEGGYYGPQDGDVDRVVFVLQFGGASGNGYLSLHQMEEGQEALLAQGSFEGGVYKRDGTRGQQDGYEAIWETVFGEKVDYPKPRYKAPVLMNPQNFPWHQDPDCADVQRKALGTFSERKLEIEFIRLAVGTTFIPQHPSARQFLLTSSGAGHCGDAPYSPLTAIQIEPGEKAELVASEDTELLRLVIPMLAVTRAEAAAA